MNLTKTRIRDREKNDFFVINKSQDFIKVVYLFSSDWKEDLNCVASVVSTLGAVNHLFFMFN